MLLHLSPKYWDYNHSLPYPAVDYFLNSKVLHQDLAYKVMVFTLHFHTYVKSPTPPPPLCLFPSAWFLVSPQHFPAFAVLSQTFQYPSVSFYLKVISSPLIIPFLVSWLEIHMLIYFTSILLCDTVIHDYKAIFCMWEKMGLCLNVVISSSILSLKIP